MQSANCGIARHERGIADVSHHDIPAVMSVMIVQWHAPLCGVYHDAGFRIVNEVEGSRARRNASRTSCPPTSSRTGKESF
jgi:hypothetical protein